jgi:lipopolysaccharide/colanic/teichoic acid biosynthesis glycosyltransferase
VKVFPVLLDSRPAYFGGSTAPSSLLLVPMATGTLLGHIVEGLPAPLRRHLTVVPLFEPTHEYEDALRKSHPAVDDVIAAGDLCGRLAGYEPSDWLMMVDPRCFPAEGLRAEALLEGLGGRARWVRHLVALESNAAGTRECVEVDGEGRVRRIQRYFDDVTWNFAAGVCCSLLPASSFALLRDVPLTSLAQLRAALATLGVPSHDVSVSGPAYNLGDERGLLRLTERVVLDLAARANGHAHPTSSFLPVHTGSGARVDPSARFVGPVVVQEGAVIEAGARVVGPALIGAGAHVGIEATVVQCVLGPYAVAAAQSIVRHRLMLVDESESAAAPARAPLPSAEEWPLLLLREPPLRVDGAEPTLYAHVKVVGEAVIALLALVLLSPLLALIAVAIKLDSPGPVFYGDEREGLGGRTFRCFKFRTMRVGADALQRELMANNELDGPQFKLEGDPRVTPLGRILRTLNLDELPQLFNVLLGQMSLVGPRPSPFRENQMCIPWRDARLSVRPGITGLWQVCRHERKAGDFHQWIHYDLLYVRHMSFMVDLKIVLATIWTLGGKGHVAPSLIIPDRRRRRRQQRRAGEEASMPAGLQPHGPRNWFDDSGGERQ